MKKNIIGIIIVVDNWPFEAESPTISSLFKNTSSITKDYSLNGVSSLKNIYATIGCGYKVENDLEKVVTKLSRLNNTVKFHDKDTLHIICVLDSTNLKFLDEILKFLVQFHLKKINFHLLFSDIEIISALRQIQGLLTIINDYRHINISSICGGLFSIYGTYENILESYNAIVLGNASFSFRKAEEYIEKNYENNISDPFIKPAVHRSYKGMKNGDHVLFIDLKRTQVNKLLQALTEDEFEFFERKKLPTFSSVTTLLEINEKISSLIPVEKFDQRLAKVINDEGIHQLRVGCKEKIDLVTYHFNGRTSKLDSEEWLIVNSPHIFFKNNFYTISDNIIERTLFKLNGEQYGFTLINYPYIDVMSYFRNQSATTIAIEVTDAGINKIMRWVDGRDNAFMLLVLLSSINSEVIKGRLTLYYPSKNFIKLKEVCCFEDIAPTILELYEIEKKYEKLAGQSLCILE